MWTAAPALVVILVISYVFAGPSSVPSALVAWGTILLAFVTFQLVRSVTIQEKSRKENEQAKEIRDKDERLLNEIIEWAVAIIKVETPVESTVFIGNIDDESSRRLVLSTLGLLRNKFRERIATSIYISRICLAFGEKLKSSVTALDGYLRKQEDIIIECQNIVIERRLSEFDTAWNTLIKHWEELGESAVTVVDEGIIEKFKVLTGV